MKEHFEPSPGASSGKIEHQLEFHADEDPLKAETEGILNSFRHKKFSRLFNPKTKTFEKPNDVDVAEEIFNIRYPKGLGHPQVGHFAVLANALDESGSHVGGGWVESFENEYDAERCSYIIRRIDPRHKPEVVSNKDW